MWARLFDRFVPPEIADRGGDDLLRARVVVGSAFGIVGWGPVFALAHTIFGLWDLVLMFTLATGVCAAVPLVLRHTGSTRAASWLLCADLIAIIGYGSSQTGGVTSPALMWFIALPVLIALTVDLAAARRLAVLVLALLAGVYGYGAFGPGFVDVLTADQRAILYAMGVGGLLVLVLTETAIFAGMRAATLRELARARDEAESANRAKSDFLARVSHELRTPLNAIIGYSELLREEPDELGTAQSLQDLGRIEGSARHLLGLIDDVLDMSKMEAGALTVAPSAVAVEPVLGEVADTVTPMVDANDNRLVVEPPGGELTVWADRHRLVQCLLNLLSNAAKFTHAGEVRLRVEAGPDHVIFEVADSGIGMTAEQLEAVFRPFVQVSASPGSRYRGTGLGLPITSRLVEMMGGSLEATSTPGEGTCFRLALGRQGPLPAAQAIR